MHMSTSEQHQKISGYALLVIMLFVFFALLLKNTGLFPFIFGDEYTYSLYSRLQPLSESSIPGYIYQAVYGLTNHCAADFLGCARIFNAFFFVCAAPFIYQVSRRVMKELPALVITLCALIAPINTYTAHYMPEAFYFFGFWAFVWAMTRARIDSPRDWAIAGFILGCTALIKPHSMLFVPAVVLYIGYVSLAVEQGKAMLAVRNIGLFLLAAIAAKFIISFILAGSAGLTLFGPSYSKIASEASGLDRLILLTRLALESIKGHLLGLCMTMGIAIAVTLHAGLKPLLARHTPDETQKIAVFALLLIANLVAVVALFTASVVSVNAHESVTRLHVRYYDFAFPLLWIVVASLLSKFDTLQPRRWRIILATLIGLALIYGVITQLTPYEPSITDSPELRGMLANSTSLYFMGTLGLMALAAWAYNPRTGAKVAIYLVLPITVVLSSYWATKDQRAYLLPSVADRAGAFTRQYLSQEERAQTVIAGSDLGTLMKAAFHIDIPAPWPFILTASTSYDLQGIAPEKQWLLSIGNYAPPAEGRVQIRMPGFTLTKIHLP